MRLPTRGFSLIEVMTATAVAVTLAAVALPSFQHQRLKAGRSDATMALLHVQAAQETYRANAGLYATTLQGLGRSPHSPEGLYRLEMTAQAEGYVVTAHSDGRQAADNACPTLFLAVKRGFASFGPTGLCWGH